jgi:Fuc2NAc and GlcNAc transferase
VPPTTLLPPPPPLAVGLGALLGWLLLRALIPLLRQRLLDQPNLRSSHRVPTPRGGGIAFVLVGSALAPLCGSGTMAWIPLVCCPLAVVGILDDRFDLPASLRYGAQILTAAALVALAATPLTTWQIPVALIAVTAVINFLNFMDGLDGLVASSCLPLLTVSALALSQAGGPALWPLVGALLGFLVWNWSPARVFMGDAGSTFLGAVLAGACLQQPTLASCLGLLLAGFPLLGDACLCVLRRAAAGEPIFRAHRLHLYQRLQQAGWSHARVTTTYAVAVGVLATAWWLGGLGLLLPLMAGELLLGVWLDRRFAGPFAVAMSCSRAPKLP